MHRLLPLLSRLALWLAAAVLVVALVRLALLLVAGPTLPVDELAPPTAAIPAADSGPKQTVAGWHLFGVSGPVATVAAAPETTLRLFLRGTLSDAGDGSGVAIIADANGSERGYRIGDSLPGDARLVAIQAGRVELERNGKRESLSLPNTTVSETGSGVAPPSRSPAGGSASGANRPLPGAAGTPFVNPIMSFGAPDMQTAREQALPDLRAMAGDVNILPVLENGSMVGVRLSGKRGSDLLSRYGILPNDVITSVNGVPLDGPQRQAELTRSLSTSTQVQLTLRRDGKELQLTLGLR